MLQFEVMNSAQKGRLITVKDGLTIGSASTCSVRVRHAQIQDIHVHCFAEDGVMIIEIANDAARMLVNGRDVARAALKHHDELTIGPLQLRVNDTSLVVAHKRSLDELIAGLDEHHDDGEVFDFARDDLFYLIAKDPALRKSITFTIPSKDKFIEQAQVFLSRMAKSTGMEEQQVDAFMTCAKELILNAHRHGHLFDETKTITITYRDLGDKVALTITDQGSGFDHRTMLAAVQKKNAAQAARERYQAGGVGGLGFQMITRLARDLKYNDTGNQVSFTVLKKS